MDMSSNYKMIQKVLRILNTELPNWSIKREGSRRVIVCRREDSRGILIIDPSARYGWFVLLIINGIVLRRTRHPGETFDSYETLGRILAQTAFDIDNHLVQEIANYIDSSYEYTNPAVVLYRNSSDLSWNIAYHHALSDGKVQLTIGPMDKLSIFNEATGEYVSGFIDDIPNDVLEYATSL